MIDPTAAVASGAAESITNVALLYRNPEAEPAPQRYTAVRCDLPPEEALDCANPAWAAPSVITWGPAPYRTWFRAMWNPHGLLVRFDAEDDRPWHTLTGRDSSLWLEEVVELFLDPAAAGRNYAEVEISPANIVCDLRIAEGWPTLAGDREWDWTGMVTRVSTRPSPEGTGSGSWTATAWLPWDGLRSLSAEAGAKLPPRENDAWRFNVFRIKRPGGPDQPERDAVYAAWSVPDGPSFHVPAVFREFVFA